MYSVYRYRVRYYIIKILFLINFPVWKCHFHFIGVFPFLSLVWTSFVICDVSIMSANITTFHIHTSYSNNKMYFDVISVVLRWLTDCKCILNKKNIMNETVENIIKTHYSIIIFCHAIVFNSQENRLSLSELHFFLYIFYIIFTWARWRWRSVIFSMKAKQKKRTSNQYNDATTENITKILRNEMWNEANTK